MRPFRFLAEASRLREGLRARTGIDVTEDDQLAPVVERLAGT